MLVLSGESTADTGGTASRVRPGDVVVVPPDTDLAIENCGDQPLWLLAVMPCGGQGRIDGEATTLPWMV